MLGLTDRAVAAIRFQSFQTYGVGSSPWSTLAVTRYLLDRNPACVVLPSEEVLSLDDKKRYAATMHPLWYRILTAPDIEDRYRPVGYVKIHDAKYMYFFLRNDIPFPPGVFELPARGVSGNQGLRVTGGPVGPIVTRGSNTMDSAVTSFLSTLTGTVEPLSREVNLAYWEAATTGSAAAFDRFTDFQLRLKKVFSSAEDFEKIRRGGTAPG